MSTQITENKYFDIFIDGERFDDDIYIDGNHVSLVTVSKDVITIYLDSGTIIKYQYNHSQPVSDESLIIRQRLHNVLSQMKEKFGFNIDL